MTKKKNDKSRPAQAYAVGYGKPPVSTRFKKGQSGNPHGTRRRRQGIPEAFERALWRRVRVRDGDVFRFQDAIEVMFFNLVAQAVKGDRRAINDVLKIADKLRIPMEQVARSINIKLVRATHPRPPGARPPKLVSDEEIERINERFRHTANGS